MLVFACFVSYLYCFDLVWNYASLLFLILLYFHVSLLVESYSFITEFIWLLLLIITWNMSCFSWGYLTILYIILLFLMYSCFLRLFLFVFPPFVTVFLLYWTSSSVFVFCLVKNPTLVYFFQLNLTLSIMFSNYYVFCLSSLDKVLLLIQLFWCL